MKIKINDATELQIDYLVAKIEGDRTGKPEWYMEWFWNRDRRFFPYSPSTAWEQAGPLIEREKIGVYPSEAYEGMWAARNLTLPHIYGPTLLIAAMRCYCASKLGDEVEIPSELQP